jgi:thiol-disulfide isomerase/thioredoxin
MPIASACACAIACAIASSACDEQKTAIPGAPANAGGRSEAVLAKDAPAQAPSSPSSALAAHGASAPDAATTPKTPRRICEAELAKPTSHALPRVTFDVRAAAGATASEPRLETGGGLWTWVNFFAAWCGPCKEEIPRLRGWEQKLKTALRVRFISLDDDERQLGHFLDEQPAAGVRTALWLKPGGARDGFLAGLKLPPSPSLPAHALLDPQGHVRCAFEGAIDEADFAQVESIVARH